MQLSRCIAISIALACACGCGGATSGMWAAAARPDLRFAGFDGIVWEPGTHPPQYRALTARYSAPKFWRANSSRAEKFYVEFPTAPDGSPLPQHRYDGASRDFV